jgi:hypothetical protein
MEYIYKQLPQKKEKKREKKKRKKKKKRTYTQTHCADQTTLLHYIYVIQIIIKTSTS